MVNLQFTTSTGAIGQLDAHGLKELQTVICYVLKTKASKTPVRFGMR